MECVQCQQNLEQIAQYASLQLPCGHLICVKCLHERHQESLSSQDKQQGLNRQQSSSELELWGIPDIICNWCKGANKQEKEIQTNKNGVKSQSKQTIQSQDKIQKIQKQVGIQSQLLVKATKKQNAYDEQRLQRINSFKIGLHQSGFISPKNKSSASPQLQLDDLKNLKNQQGAVSPSNKQSLISPPKKKESGSRIRSEESLKKPPEQLDLKLIAQGKDQNNLKCSEQINIKSSDNLAYKNNDYQQLKQRDLIVLNGNYVSGQGQQHVPQMILRQKEPGIKKKIEYPSENIKSKKGTIKLGQRKEKKDKIFPRQLFQNETEIQGSSSNDEASAGAYHQFAILNNSQEEELKINQDEQTLSSKVKSSIHEKSHNIQPKILHSPKSMTRASKKNETSETPSSTFKLYQTDNQNINITNNQGTLNGQSSNNINSNQINLNKFAHNQTNNNSNNNHNIMIEQSILNAFNIPKHQRRQNKEDNQNQDALYHRFQHHLKRNSSDNQKKQIFIQQGCHSTERQSSNGSILSNNQEEQEQNMDYVSFCKSKEETCIEENNSNKQQEKQSDSKSRSNKEQKEIVKENVSPSVEDIALTETSPSGRAGLASEFRASELSESRVQSQRQLSSLRQSLKISIHQQEVLTGPQSATAATANGGFNLYQIQEKDSQQNTQRQHGFEQHSLLDINWNQVQLAAKTIQELKRGERVKCCAHQETFSLYCEKDKTLLCVSCLFDTEDHSKHTVVPLKAASNAVQTATNLFKGQLKDKTIQVDEYIKKASLNRSLLERGFEKSLHSLSREFQLLKSHLAQKQKQLEDQIAKSFESALYKYDSLLSDLKEIRSCNVEAQKNYGLPTQQPPTSASNNSLDSVVKDHFVFDLLLKSLKNLRLTISDIKKTDLDILQIKYKEELKSCISELGNVRFLQDFHIGIKKGNDSTQMQSIGNSNINSPKGRGPQSSSNNNASNKSSARETADSISPTRYNYVQRTLQAHFSSQKRQKIKAADISQRQSQYSSTNEITPRSHPLNVKQAAYHTSHPYGSVSNNHGNQSGNNSSNQVNQSQNQQSYGGNTSHQVGNNSQVHYSQLNSTHFINVNSSGAVNKNNGYSNSFSHNIHNSISKQQQPNSNHQHESYSLQAYNVLAPSNSSSNILRLPNNQNHSISNQSNLISNQSNYATNQSISNNNNNTNVSHYNSNQNNSISNQGSTHQLNNKDVIISLGAANKQQLNSLSNNNPRKELEDDIIEENKGVSYLKSCKYIGPESFISIGPYSQKYLKPKNSASSKNQLSSTSNPIEPKSNKASDQASYASQAAATVFFLQNKRFREQQQGQSTSIN